MLHNPYLLSDIIWRIHCLKDANGWPRPCPHREEGRGMLGMALGSLNMAQTPSEGLWWRLGEGESG